MIFLFSLGFLSLLYQGNSIVMGLEKEFRFDYDYSEEADGWLKLHVIPAVWQEARMRCHAEGAVLASPLSSQLKTAILELASNMNLSQPFIFTGVHATFSKGDYFSIEGVPLAHLPITWAPGEPDNLENSESCLVMLTDGNGGMADARCGEPSPYVCYKKMSQKTIQILNACGTIDPEYNLDERTGSCYKFHRRALTWSRAYMVCAGEGGHLVVINSDREAAVLTELMAKNPLNTIRSVHPEVTAVGFHDWDEHSTWMTIHGETLEAAGYSKWEGGQPNNVTRDRSGDKGQFCGAMYRNARLNDMWCNVPIPFICEKPIYDLPQK